MTVSALLFDYLRKMVQDQCGVNLENDRDYLVESMVQPALAEWNCPSLSQLMETLKDDPSGPLSRQVAESLVPNETYFFRDPAFFHVLEKDIIPSLIRKNFQKHKLRIWCAASSSGQEAYSLMILLKDKFPFLFDWDFQFVASDFSKSILAQAQRGIYSSMEVQRGLPKDYLGRFFVPHEDGWQIREDIRKQVEFRQINLKESWLAEEDVDLLLIRNVLIYFDVEMKKEILLKCRRSMNPEGYLFLGSSETALFLNGAFEGISFEDNVTGYKVRRAAMETQEISSESIERFIKDLWSTVLGLEITEDTPGGSWRNTGGSYTAWIRIIGTLNLVVLLQCNEKLSQEVAATMFGTDLEQTRVDQINDSMKELVNILGGNIKGLTSKYHFLSIPAVLELNQQPNFFGGEVMYEADFISNNQPLKLKVLNLKSE